MRYFVVFLCCFGAFGPVMATETYFSTCDYEPANPGCNGLDATNSAGFTCDQVASGSACGSTPGDFVSSACHCPAEYSTFDLCDDWLLLQSDLTGGTRDNPWCLSPESGDDRISFSALIDGNVGTNLATDAAAGDTIYLCDGACDGAASGIGGVYYLEPSVLYANGNRCTTPNAQAFMSPRVSGTAGNPITIQPYCTPEGACETVTWDFDADADGLASSDEVNSIFANGKTGTGSASTGRIGVEYWTIDGDPLNQGVKHIQVEHLRNGTTFMLDCTDESGDGSVSDGPGNLTFHGMSFRGHGNGTWTGRDIGDVCSTNNTAGYFWKINNASGPINITDNDFYDGCSMWTRFNNNDAAAAIMTIDGNHVENWSIISNDHSFLSCADELAHNGPDSTYYYTNNTIIDAAGGFSTENHMQHLYIQGNTITCSGTRHPYGTSNGKGVCFGFPAIGISAGDTPACSHTCVGGSQNGCTCPNGGCPGGTCSGPAICTNDDIHITGNTIYGVGSSSVTNSQGLLANGIDISTVHYSGTFPTGIFVENNIIYGQGAAFSGYPSGGIALWLRSDSEGITARNNTLYFDYFPLVIEGAPQTVTRNLIVRAQRPFSGSDSVEVTVLSGAEATTFTANTIHPGPNSGNVVTISGGTDYTCGTVSGLGSGNVCVPPVFRSCDSTSVCYDANSGTPNNLPATWNLHLMGLDSSAYNADASCGGTTTDIDGEDRPWPSGSACDIGADEVVFVPVQPTPTIPKRPAGVP